MNKGARRKGYIKNLKTGKLKHFLFNPTSLNRNMGANFNSMSAPGSSYPKFQYINGRESNISIDLFLYGNRGEVTDFIKFLETLLPPQKSGGMFSPPPTLLFVFGSTVRKCILETMNENTTLFDRNLNPRIATVSLSMKVVA